MMRYQTQYLEIHEKAYKRLRSSGKLSWSEIDDLEERISFYRESLQQQGIAHGSSLLILGCGDGETSLSLAALGYKVVGVDVSSIAIQWANEKAEQREVKCSFIVKNLVSDDLQLEPFDAIIDDHCLHCIIGPDRAVVFDRICSMLKQNGIFIMRTHCGDPPTTSPPEILKTWDPISRCQVHEGIAGRYLGLPDALMRELRTAGLFAIQNRTFECSNGWGMFEAIVKSAPTRGLP